MSKRGVVLLIATVLGLTANSWAESMDKYCSQDLEEAGKGLVREQVVPGFLDEVWQATLNAVQGANARIVARDEAANFLSYAIGDEPTTGKPVVRVNV